MVEIATLPVNAPSPPSKLHHHHRRTVSSSSSFSSLSSSFSSPSSSSSSSDSHRGRSQRPAMSSSRKPSMTIIPISSDLASSSSVATQYPVDDPRAMSPRRNSEETEELEEATRLAVQEHARQMQHNLLEIAESIELVRADHDKLEKQNLALQDYIGNLTRGMSQGQGQGRLGKAKK